MKIFDMKDYIPSPEELSNRELAYNITDDRLSLKTDSGLVQDILVPKREWVDVTTQRAIDKTYMNDTGKEIIVSIAIESNATFEIDSWVIVGGVNITSTKGKGTVITRNPIEIIVPPYTEYVLKVYNGQGVIHSWVELK